MKILLIGPTSVLGGELIKLARIANLSIDQLDLSIEINDHRAMREVITATYDWVISTHSLDDIEAAEDDRDGVFGINCDGIRVIADACARTEVKLLHLSTNYIFDGMKPDLYSERDVANPINVYGSSMLAAEKGIRSTGGHYLIVRTQDVFGRWSTSRCNRLIEAIRKGEEVLVSEERAFVPTSVVDLAQAVVNLIHTEHTGIINLVSEGWCTEKDFAEEVARLLGVQASIRVVSAAELKQKADHPQRALLKNRWYAIWTGESFPEWKEALARYLK